MTSSSYSGRFFIVLIAAIVVAVLTFSLGQWQLRRASQKETLQQRILAMNKLEMLDNASLLRTADPATVKDRAVQLKGRWVAAQTVYLDNRPMGEKTGFWVFTPLNLEGSNQAVLVQRGWVPRNFMDRSKLPPIETPVGVVSVAGRIAPPPSKLYAFDGTDQGKIRQNLDIDLFRQEIGFPILNMSVVQLGTASEGLKRDWPAPNLGVEKHYGYAFQWFSLSALVVGLYAWFQLISPLRRRRSGKSAGVKESASD